MNKIKSVWSDLGRTIYVGNRLKANMRALTFVSTVTAILGLSLIILNIINHNTKLLIMSILTFAASVLCGFLVVIKKREIAIIIPTMFSVLVFTIYAFTGAGEGTGILWSLLVPIGIGYFVSVRYGIILSTYYSVLYFIVFYTPLRDNIQDFYSVPFMERFPILYASISIFTEMAMVQYHKNALLEIDYTKRLNKEVKKQTALVEEKSKKIEQMSFQTIQTLANAIDAKDPYTQGHSNRVSLYSVKLAEALGWDHERIEDLRFAAMLHDIGKIGVPDSILNNPRRLTDVEYDIIKSHTTVGGDILKDKVIITQAEDVARSHHERYDGTGYPKGLKGKEISEEARIVAIADAFDAMSSSRVYRKACKSDHILHELNEGKGKQFDPEMIPVFINLWESGELDEILKHDVVVEDETTEISSILLQEVVETFASQSQTEDIDITTGIRGRTSGETEIAATMRETAGCLVFFDIDNLKKINDTQGHDVGDKLLKMMGDTLLTNCEHDICCRLGGDEFLVFTKHITKQEAADKVLRIIDDFEERKKEDERLAPASLSAGMAMSKLEDTYSEVYSRADKALYHIKQNGKKGYEFYRKDTDGIDNQADINKIVSSIQTSGSYSGAMGVEYREFTKLYEFIKNLEKRFSHPFKLVMITLESEDKNDPGSRELEKAMYYMEQAILQTIRDVDIMTRYNKLQFLVILLGTDQDGVTSAVDRIFRGYYKMNGSGSYSPSYTIEGE